MAFTAAGTTTGAVLIKEKYQDAVADCVYINNQFLSQFGEPIPQRGGRYVNWFAHNSGNSSVEVFTEGKTQPNSGNQGHVLAQVGWTYIRAIVEITGMARDQMVDAYADGIDSEIIGAANDIRDLFNTSFMGGTYGLELAIDAGSTYAGIARGSAAYWESTETAHNAACSFAALQTLEEAIRDNDKGGSPKKIFCPWNQVSNIYNLGGMPFVKTAGPQDQAANAFNPMWNGMPVIGLGDMTDTVIVMLDPADCQVHQIRGFQVDYQGRAGDADVYQLSMGLAFVVRRPKLHGKLTGVTA